MNYTVNATLVNAAHDPDYPEIFNLNTRIEFYEQPGTYGNGYGMYVQGDGEPFGGQAYDIRYDKRFRNDRKADFIKQFYCDRFDGKGTVWKLDRITITEG